MASLCKAKQMTSEAYFLKNTIQNTWTLEKYSVLRIDKRITAKQSQSIFRILEAKKNNG